MEVDVRSLVLLGVCLVFGAASTAFAGVAPDCSELTALQKFAGFVTFGNIMLTGGIVGAVGFLVWLLYLIDIPKTVYEIGGYAVSLGLVMYGKDLHLGIDPAFIAFAGCIGFGAMLMVSAALHDLEPNMTAYFSTLTLAWAAVAVAYQSELVGFFAVGALFGTLGFIVRSYPFMTVIGFESEDALNRATGAAFVLLALFIGFRISGATASFIHLFSYGTYLIGSLVGFTGLLILAYEGYKDSGGYIARQIPIIVFGIAALFFGSVLAIPELQKIGGTFFGLYLLEKICDVPTNGKIGYAFKGLVISCIALGAGYLILSHQELFAPYILLM